MVEPSSSFMHSTVAIMRLATTPPSGEYVTAVRAPTFKNDDVPKVADPYWKSVTAPLLVFMASDHSVDEIVEWGRSQGHTGTRIRHMIAFLSFSDLVHYEPSTRLWKSGAEPPYKHQPDVERDEPKEP